MKTFTLRTQDDLLIIPRDESVVRSIFLNNVIQVRDLIFQSDRERSQLYRFLFLVAAKHGLENKDDQKVTVSPIAYFARELVFGAK